MYPHPLPLHTVFLLNHILKILCHFFPEKKIQKKQKFEKFRSCCMTCVCVMNHLEDFRVNFLNLTDSLFFCYCLVMSYYERANDSMQ